MDGVCDKDFWDWSHFVFFDWRENGVDKEGRAVGGYYVLLDFTADFNCSIFSFVSKLARIWIALILSTHLAGASTLELVNVVGLCVSFTVRTAGN